MMNHYEISAKGNRYDWAIYRLHNQVKQLEGQVTQLEKTVAYLKEVMDEQIKRYECEKLRNRLIQLEEELKREWC